MCSPGQSGVCSPGPAPAAVVPSIRPDAGGHTHHVSDVCLLVGGMEEVRPGPRSPDPHVVPAVRLLQPTSVESVRQERERHLLKRDGPGEGEGRSGGLAGLQVPRPPHLPPVPATFTVLGHTQLLHSSIVSYNLDFSVICFIP